MCTATAVLGFVLTAAATVLRLVGEKRTECNASSKCAQNFLLGGGFDYEPIQYIICFISKYGYKIIS
jgi:hypothetical protein